VEKISLANKLTVSGKISPAEEVKVVPKAPGKVARVNCEVGQSVRAGDILIELENSDIRARLDSARAALAVSEANLERARIQLEKSKIQLDDAKRLFERKKALYDNGAISLSDYEAAGSSFESVKKDYEINKAGVASSQASVDQSRASVRQIEVELENSMVVSPVSGIIASRSVTAGEFVSNSSAAVVVVNIDKVEINSGLMEDEINFVKQGQEVEVTVTAVSSKPFKGKVTKISPSADAKTKVYPIWVAIDNPDRVLKPGMFAEIRLQTRQREGVLAVPAEAVVERSGQKAVYVAQGDVAVERKVKVGVSEGGKAEITEGLKGEEMVIVTGLQSLKNGQPISLQGAAPGGPPGAPSGAQPRGKGTK
jgi:RND family efflux transporter MFP subunit